MGVHAIDEAEATAWADGGIPSPARVRDGIWMLPIPMAHNPMRYTLSYLVEDDRGGLHVIDPGWPSPDTDERFAGFLAGIGHPVDDVATVTVTHHHPDHAGAAQELRRASGAAVLMHLDESETLFAAPTPDAHAAQLDAWGVPVRERARMALPRRADGIPAPPAADMTLRDGDTLPIPGRTLEVVATPGHTAGHICLAARDEGVLFSGDHLMPTVHCGLGLGGTLRGNALAVFLSSLDAVRPFAAAEIAPGHQYRFRGGEARIDSTASHHLRRCDGIRALPVDEMSTWEVASRLRWRGGWDSLSGFYLYSALRQTEMYVEYVATAPASGVHE